MQVMFMSKRTPSAPRKCGIATSARHPQSLCFAVPVNDIDGCYRYPEVVRFEIEEQDLGSYRCAIDFLNTGNVDIVLVQHEFGVFGETAGATCWPCCAD
jgi:hypothetical protein